MNKGLSGIVIFLALFCLLFAGCSAKRQAGLQQRIELLKPAKSSQSMRQESQEAYSGALEAVPEPENRETVIEPVKEPELALASDEEFDREFERKMAQMRKEHDKLLAKPEASQEVKPAQKPAPEKKRKGLWLFISVLLAISLSWLLFYFLKRKKMS